MNRTILTLPNLFLSIWGLDQSSLSVLNEFLKVNNVLRYFIQVGRVFKMGIDAEVAPPHSQICFNFKP